MSLELLLERAQWRGEILPPPSKSLAQRLILCAALAEGESRISDLAPSDDLAAFLRAAESFGAKLRETEEGKLAIRGCGGKPLSEPPTIDCGESGAALRILLPVALALSGGGIFLGQGRLLQRPLSPFLSLLREKTIAFDLSDTCLNVRGALPAGFYALPGDVSSQFFSGLLFGLSLVEGVSEIAALTPLESAGYVDLTISSLSIAGVETERDGERFFTRGQPFRAFSAAVEADRSQAAFFLAAQALGNPLRVLGLERASGQPDACFPGLASQLLRPGFVELKLQNCPDLLPPLALLAALREGETLLSGAKRLRYKESDRLRSVSLALRALGADIEEGNDQLRFRGVESLHGGEVDAMGDHRVAMMCAVAATRLSEGAILLHGADAVRKSYPRFWEEVQRLGGNVHVVRLG